MDIRLFEGRKAEHLRHALNPDHQATGRGGLDRVHLHHEALPEMDLEDVRLEAPCLGKPLATPFAITGMTAGHPEAGRINEALAAACLQQGWALGIGSQRREVETGDLHEWENLRAAFPALSLFGNLGLSQLVERTTGQIVDFLSQLGADAIVIHLNALQEALQPEGTPRFRDGLQALQDLCANSPVPVILKETGCGFSHTTLARLRGLGLAAIDVSGLGGTHWGRIEGARAGEESLEKAAAVTFAEWGESTVESVLAARRVLGGEDTEIWASGGVRSGLDAAKLIALGADRVGYAQPALQALNESPEALRRWMQLQEFELRIALFCTGCKTPSELQKKEDAWKVSAI